MGDLSITSECDGTTSQDVADQWNLDNIALLEACASDSCDTNVTVTSNFNYNNLLTDCGNTGTLGVTYTIGDQCQNIVKLDLELILEDTTPPNIDTCALTDLDIDCGTSDIELQAIQWNDDNLSILNNCAEDSCSTTITITSDFDIDNVMNSNNIP